MAFLNEPVYAKSVPYKKGQCGIAPSSISGTVDQEILSSLGLNPLSISDDELSAIEINGDETQLITAALEHVTVSIQDGHMETSIFLSKMQLYSYVPSDAFREAQNMGLTQRFQKFKSFVTSPVICGCSVCSKIEKWGEEWEKNPHYEKSTLVVLLSTCREIDVTLPTEAYDQSGSELLLAMTEFTLYKSKLHYCKAFLKCVGLEVACFVSTDSSGKEATCYNARSDLVVKIVNRSNKSSDVLATGEVSKSPVVQTYVAALGFLSKSRSKYILCIILHKNISVSLYLGVNKQDSTSIDSAYTGPISLVSLMGDDLYDLNKPDEVTLLIKHLGSALKKVFDKRKGDHTQTSQARQTRQTRQTTRPRLQSEGETPPSKKRNTTS